ncbi:dihydroxy-acid dehydratase domain-containing protein [Bartonella raoultii]|uniref:dihydroxy-acid dehydratase domain-containing protein n=1 Tax=Bartonella raoultii TaxID=1457020 RepID=UPI00280AFBC3|nr:dihydroxy-acid dehydratase [Bartonella raoultii]
MANINHFHAAGSMGFVTPKLMEVGLAHEDICTIFGEDLTAYAIKERLYTDNCVVHEPALRKSGHHTVLVRWRKSFQSDSGVCILSRDLDADIMKVSAVKLKHLQIKESVFVFNDKEEL